jgi:hypothetical protein
VKSVVVYGNETWTVAEMDIKRLGTWKRKILRWIYGRAINMESKIFFLMIRRTPRSTHSSMY